MEDHISQQPHHESEREQQILTQVQALHNQISHKLFTLEIVSAIHDQVFSATPTNSTNIEVLDRYIRSLARPTELRLRNEVMIFSVTGQVSSYFVHNQQLADSAVDELSEIVNEWAVISKLPRAVGPASKVAMAIRLLSKFDMFRMTWGFETWTQQHLKDFHYCLRGEASLRGTGKRQYNEGQLLLFIDIRFA